MPAVVVFTAPDPPTPTLLLLLLFPIRRLALLPTDRQIDLTFEKENVGFPRHSVPTVSRRPVQFASVSC